MPSLSGDRSCWIYPDVCFPWYRSSDRQPRIGVSADFIQTLCMLTQKEIITTGSGRDKTGNNATRTSHNHGGDYDTDSQADQPRGSDAVQWVHTSGTRVRSDGTHDARTACAGGWGGLRLHEVTAIGRPSHTGVGLHRAAVATVGLVSRPHVSGCGVGPKVKNFTASSVKMTNEVCSYNELKN